MKKSNEWKETNTIDIKRIITEEIAHFVARADQADGIKRWRTPLVGFADVQSPEIRNLKVAAGEKHLFPEDIMEDARIVIAYFIPFEEKIVQENATGEMASKSWAAAYEITNAMFPKLNEHIIHLLEELGYNGQTAGEYAGFSVEELRSRWSYRHFAYAAGLGTFGINNMMITEKGCAGRVNTIITNLDVKPDSAQKEERCLYKANGSCGLCFHVCPVGALTSDGFKRELCYVQCAKNARIHQENYGSDYGSGAGSEVCGKCITGMPCGFYQ
ncbi:MAG: hypothetical protein ACOX00_09860 [Peptoniphilaceae bacterium]|jgi:epoxyqueuosine reductase QueG|nr:epoxyqueuosine reductase [Bacillota bacterium]